MIETNIRIVHPGIGLFLRVRTANLKGVSLTPDLAEKACGILRRRYGFSAVKVPSTNEQLLVATDALIPSFTIAEKDWEIEVFDSGMEEQRIYLADSVGYQVIPQLIERSLLATLDRRSDLWTLDSPRIYYEDQPFTVKENVAAYQRYEIGVLPVDDVGIGIAVDISTAFFTSQPVSYYFDQNLNATDRKEREIIFSALTGRQDGQKGTLLYDTGNRKVKCYFERFAINETCSSTPSIRVDDRRYESLYEYYKAKNPALSVDKSASVAYVSFRGIDRPQPVAADMIRARIMNDNLPEALTSVDKVPPEQRRPEIEKFWRILGDSPLGRNAPKLIPGFWCPPSSHIFQLTIPDLVFGQEEILRKPEMASKDKHNQNYRMRERLMGVKGCYSVSPTMPRTIHCAYPSKIIDEVLARQLALDISSRISQLTNITVAFQLFPYERVLDVSEELRSTDSGEVAIFVLDDEPVSYYNASYMLPGWRIKRITNRVLEQKYKNLSKGKWDKKTGSYNLDLGKKQWDSFINMNVFSLLFLLDAVPFKVNKLGVYDAQLAVDVGHDRRFFSLSLLIAREENSYPSFFVRPNVYEKPDVQHEAINPVILSDSVYDMFRNTFRRRFDPLRSILILRDGQISGKEQNALDEAIQKLKENGFITADARVDFVEIHKDTSKAVRLWERDGTSTTNTLEGKLLILNKSSAVFLSTGLSTVHQGTADPMLIKANGQCLSLLDAAQSLFDSAQLNWFSPGVAQKLPLVLKLADDELSARAAQEIRRVK